MIGLEAVFNSLDFTSNLIFRHVLSSDIELCRELIQRIIPDADS